MGHKAHERLFGASTAGDKRPVNVIEAIAATTNEWLRLGYFGPDVARDAERTVVMEVR